MAGNITLWGASELLRTFFSRTAVAPDAFYLALITDVAPTPYLSGEELNEPLAPEYVRAMIPNDDLTWTNDGQMQVVSCEAEIQFVTAVESWGTVRYWALCNAEVEGGVYFVGEFESPEQVEMDDQVVIAAGNLTASLGPFFTTEES